MKTMRWICLLGLLCAAGIAADDTAALPAGKGREAVGKMCVDCHALDVIRALRLSKDAWSQKVNEMVDRGAQGTPEEIAAVTEYLAANFGPEAKVHVNTAPVDELRTVLGFSPAEAKAVVDWRGSHPAFKGWEDVAAVPGVDRAKVEAKKGMMNFAAADQE